VTPVVKVRSRRQEILERATDLFAERGFEGTSVRSIAAACGVTEAAIYRHFDHKHHLYEEVIRSKAEQHDITGRLQRFAGKGSIEDVLLSLSDHLLSITTADPTLMRLMFNNSLESGAEAAALFREVRLPYVEFLSRELTERAQAGEIRPVDSFITARCFVGMVMDCALNYGVWNRIVHLELTARDVYCDTVPIFARGLQMP
jgi:AcrR family transcriptional regulator